MAILFGCCRLERTEGGSLLSVSPLACHVPLGKSAEMFWQENTTFKKRKIQNWNIAAKSEPVCLVMALLHFLGVVIRGLMLIISSAMQAHAAVQFSYQLATFSWLTRGRASQRGHGRWNPCFDAWSRWGTSLCARHCFSAKYLLDFVLIVSFPKRTTFSVKTCFSRKILTSPI